MILLAGTTTVTGGLNVGGNTTLTGNLTVNGTTTTINSSVKAIADQYTEVNSPVDGQAYVAGQAGGLVSVNTATTTGTGATQTHVAATAGGIRFNPNPAGDGSIAARWELNNAIADASSNGSINGDANWTAIGTGALTGLQAGQGIAIASTGTVDGLTGTAANPIVSVNLTADAAGAGGLAFTAVSGNGNDTLGIDAEGITEQMLNVPGTAGTATQVLTLVDAAAGTFGWVDRADIANAGAGTVRKLTQDIVASGSADQTYTVDTTTANTAVTGSNLGINVQVVCYEDVSTGSDNSELRQFIPQSVTVTAAGVTVVVPAGGVKGRIVITG